MKICSKCNIEKEEDEYYRNKNNPHGRSYSCKDCVRIKEGKKKKVIPEKAKNVPDGKKYCYSCDEVKSIKAYHNDKRRKDGKNPYCKICAGEKSAKHRKDNEEHYRQYDREYREKNRDTLIEKSKKYYEENKEELLVKQKEYLDNNREKKKERDKKYYESNKEKFQQYRIDNAEKMKEYNKKKWQKTKKDPERLEKVRVGKKKHYDANIEKIADYRKEWYSKRENKDKVNKYQVDRKKKDPLYKLRCNLRALVLKVISNGGYSKKSKTHKILGASFEVVLEHLNNNPYGFKYGNKEIDIDHTIPVSSALNEEEMIKLNHYTNLQLLPSYYNRYIKRDNPFDKEELEEWLDVEYNK